MIKFLDIAAQYASIKGEIDRAVASVIADSAFIGGKHVKSFEEHFAEYQQVSHCIGVGNGTDGLEIVLEALGLPEGSEVIVPANTFIATAEAVTKAGHRVVFCDCNLRNYTLDTRDAERRITPLTRAIIPVHLYGHPCDMDEVLALAHAHDLRVIEDCAQAHGAEYKGKRVGGFGDAGIFSFYPGKNLGAYGDAGAIVTNDGDLGRTCRMIANHGRVDKYGHQFEGRNSRLDGLQAAVLNVKLGHLDAWTQRRKENAGCYHENLAGCRQLVLPEEEPWATHVYHLFVVRVDRRDALAKHLRDQGIETGIHYPISLPKLKAYGYLGQAAERMRANESDGELLSLPVGEHLGRDQVLSIVDAIRAFFA